MSFWELIPTCDDPMSCYTLCALAIIVSANLFAYAYLYGWSNKENRRLEKYVADDIRRVEGDIRKLESSINGHDDYIDNMNGVINNIRVDSEVQKTLMKGIEGDIAEIKADLKTLLKR